MTSQDYWAECISDAAGEVGLEITNEQLNHLAEAVSGAHENYGMAFYSPPASDRLRDVTRDYEAKLKAARVELEKHQDNAEKALRRALRTHSDARLSVNDRGEVFEHGGRTTRLL